MGLAWFVNEILTNGTAVDSPTYLTNIYIDAFMCYSVYVMDYYS